MIHLSESYLNHFINDCWLTSREHVTNGSQSNMQNPGNIQQVSNGPGFWYMISYYIILIPVSWRHESTWPMAANETHVRCIWCCDVVISFSVSTVIVIIAISLPYYIVIFIVILSSDPQLIRWALKAICGRSRCTWGSEYRHCR